ncbi:attractin-like protein 1 isoform X2 [Periplaneta americana]|uniref:attractin-like protein 1 isoform X2 n=1 Tax=Periplaneta americana TaxID=6978 RepID=UPI0037E99974
MAGNLQMFLFLFKSKYRRKFYFRHILLCFGVVYSFIVSVVSSTNCTSVQCVNGKCENGTTCVCFDGWQGQYCQFCGGKVRLTEKSGNIHDGHGNYSIDVKCSWLVDAGGAPNATIRLHLEEFATECGWDHLYIFDGDSVHSPLLAVFSGLMYKDGYSIRRIPEVVAHSGSALLHFYSDVAYNMTGFNISYRLNSCPSRYSHVNCSGNGVCIDGVCTCDASYMGEACDVPVCPNNCSNGHGVCNHEMHRCDCEERYKGEDCSQLATLGYWEVVQSKDFVPEGSASHGAVVWRDSLYIVGGESYRRAKMIYVYDFNGNVWETPHLDSKIVPRMRYGHSAVLFGDKIYMYGGVEENGVVSNELWAFDVSAKTWENITVRTEQCNTTVSNATVLCGPLRSAGHTATVVTSRTNKKSERMIVIFGHSPTYGYLNTVQEYHFGTRDWKVVTTQGFPVKGGYGHSAAWDPLSQRIYVYGGFVSESTSTPILSNKLYSFEPNTHKWMMLMPAPSARFLHTATFLYGGLMIVFGGNTHNDTAHSFGAKCYSSDMLAYDVTCDSWSTLSVPQGLRSDLARFGHSANIFENSLYIYGGFDGQMLSDMLRYTPGNCGSFTDQSTCLNTRPGVKCVWDKREMRCQPITDLPRIFVMTAPEPQDMQSGEEEMYSRCPEESRSSITASVITYSALCSGFPDCLSCVHTSFQCVWCGSAGCHYQRCRDNNLNNAAGVVGREVLNRVHRGRSGKEEQKCEANEGPVCHQLHNCQSCSTHNNCHWDYEQRCKAVGNATEQQEPTACTSSCAEFTLCLNCTVEECIWCQNEGRCVDKNAYTASFPYGQCREWTTHQARCRSTSGKSACSFYPTCVECRDDPACGWCDDGSGTGLGQCLPGGNAGPNQPNLSCAAGRWFFTECPTCQCNGHSTCAVNSSVCNQPCANLTQGPHCEHCVLGYYGNPVNGGKCIPCECNDQGTECHPDTGKCFCTTKGITGDHCERCDTQNHYHGDPTNKGSCFYDLTIDYQFTFNLSKKEDRHYTQINFKNSPPKPDVDADFSITCSVMAKMNVTMKAANSAERAIFTNHNCTSFRTRFNKAEHIFGIEDNVTLTTFYVYVYDFRPPLWIQISFSQYPKLNLQQFFITFSTCFLLLLLVAAILWKIKQKYDMYRRRQRLFVEMEQMASRPFSQVLVEIELREKADLCSNANPATLRKRKKDSPSPIALEPCCGNRAAVLSLLVRLPTGGEVFTPSGQSGLAIASALVTLGNPRKVSIDPTGKADTKCKSRLVTDT